MTWGSNKSVNKWSFFMSTLENFNIVGTPEQFCKANKWGTSLSGPTLDELEQKITAWAVSNVEWKMVHFWDTLDRILISPEVLGKSNGCHIIGGPEDGDPESVAIDQFVPSIQAVPFQ